MTTPLLHRIAPIVDDATRRQFLGATALTALLAGCGRAGEPAPPVAATRTVEHFGGTAQVPATVDRVVTLLGEEDLHAVLALGVRPVVSGRGSGGLDDVLARFGHDYTGIETFPFGETDLELVAAGRPDVIFDGEYIVEYDDDLYAKTQTVAPVVLIDRQQPVDTQLRLVAEVLGRQEEADRLAAEHAARVEEVRGVVAASLLASSRVAVVFADTETFGILGSTSFAGSTLRDLGVASVVDLAGSDAPDANFGGDDLSVEQLGMLEEAEIIFRVEPDIADPAAGVSSVPLWQELPAVRAGRDFPVAREVFYLQSPFVRLVRLDEIERVARELGG